MDLVLIAIYTQYIITNGSYMNSHYVLLFLDVMNILKMVVFSALTEKNNMHQYVT